MDKRMVDWRRLCQRMRLAAEQGDWLQVSVLDRKVCQWLDADLSPADRPLQQLLLATYQTVIALLARDAGELQQKMIGTDRLNDVLQAYSAVIEEE